MSRIFESLNKVGKVTKSLIIVVCSFVSLSCRVSIERTSIPPPLTTINICLVDLGSLGSSSKNIVEAGPFLSAPIRKKFFIPIVCDDGFAFDG